MLKCRGNYFRLLRSPQHKRNVPEVVKKSVCSRDGLPTARPWPPRREQPTCEKLPLNNSCCYVRRAACFSPLTPRQSLDSLPRPPLFFSPLARLHYTDRLTDRPTASSRSNDQRTVTTTTAASSSSTVHVHVHLSLVP